MGWRCHSIPTNWLLPPKYFHSALLDHFSIQISGSLFMLWRYLLFSVIIYNSPAQFTSSAAPRPWMKARLLFFPNASGGFLNSCSCLVVLDPELPKYSVGGRQTVCRIWRALKPALHTEELCGVLQELWRLVVSSGRAWTKKAGMTGAAFVSFIPGMERG